MSASEAMDVFEEPEALADGAAVCDEPIAAAQRRIVPGGYWSGKVALVTGGSAGLGLEIARTLARRGARVAIAARHPQRLQAAENQLRQEGGDVIGIVADVTDDEQVESMVAQVVEQLGGLDLLVNNVGRSTRSRILSTTVEQFRELMEVNFFSVVRTTQAAMPHLIRSKGHLVNIGSLSAKTVSPYLSAYAASKFAVAAYTQQLRVEGPPDVHYLLVCPGPIARADAGGRYDAEAMDLPERARQPGGGARLRGICPQRLARKILRACERRQPELIVPVSARLLFVIMQIWPTAGDWLVRWWTGYSRRGAASAINVPPTGPQREMTT